VLNTDLFETVEPAFAFPSPGKVDLTLNVQEKRTGAVELALGYGSRGVVGRAGISESNFLGTGQQLNFLWETGGRARRNSFEIGFTEPWIDRRNTSVSVSLFDKVVYRFSQQIGSIGGSPLEDTGNNVYFETHAGGQITVSRPFSEAYRGFVGVRYDNVRVPELPDLTDFDRTVLQNGPLSSLNLRLSHNTRDFDLEPAGGGYEIFTGDIGRADLKPVKTSDGSSPTGVFGILNYTRYGVDARRYFSPQGRRSNPKDRRTVFALRLMVGGSSGTLPFSEQYFVGGAESLRGYTEDRFWGNNMFLGSLEYRHPLAPSLTGVVFADVGDAWGGPYQNVKFSGFTQHGQPRPNLGAGLGLRVITPIGPIRIDQGFGREGAHTHFSIGHVF
jgi:outer membrane protein insertion porin family